MPGAKWREAKLILGGCMKGRAEGERERENVHLFVYANLRMYNSSLELCTCIISTTVFIVH